MNDEVDLYSYLVDASIEEWRNFFFANKEGKPVSSLSLSLSLSLSVCLSTESYGPCWAHREYKVYSLVVLSGYAYGRIWHGMFVNC